MTYVVGSFEGFFVGAFVGLEVPEKKKTLTFLVHNDQPY